MSDLPAKWLEESAANAAKKMKPDPLPVEDGNPTSSSNLPILNWSQYGPFPPDILVFALVQAGTKPVELKIMIHKKFQNKWWVNVLTQREERPDRCLFWTPCPEDFIKSFPIPLS